MMTEGRKKLTRDWPETYRIKVPGELHESWSHRAGNMSIAAVGDGEGPLVTNLTGQRDQAALHGLPRRLYSLGLPLISRTGMESG